MYYVMTILNMKLSLVVKASQRNTKSAPNQRNTTQFGLTSWSWAEVRILCIIPRFLSTWVGRYLWLILKSLYSVLLLQAICIKWLLFEIILPAFEGGLYRKVLFSFVLGIWAASNFHIFFAVRVRVYCKIKKALFSWAGVLRPLVCWSHFHTLVFFLGQTIEDW